MGNAEGSLPSAFMVVARFASGEERLVLSKFVMQFSFTYDVLRYFYICLYINHQLFYLLFMTGIPEIEENLDFVYLCLRQTAFIFNGVFYSQIEAWA